MKEKLIELQDYIKGLDDVISIVIASVKLNEYQKVLTLDMNIDKEESVKIYIHTNGYMYIDTKFEFALKENNLSTYAKGLIVLNNNLEVIKEKSMEILKDVNS